MLKTEFGEFLKVHFEMLYTPRANMILLHIPDVYPTYDEPLSR